MKLDGKKLGRLAGDIEDLYLRAEQLRTLAESPALDLALGVLVSALAVTNKRAQRVLSVYNEEVQEGNY